MVRYLPLLLPLALAACSPSRPPADPPAATTPAAADATQAAASTDLGAWHWRLAEAVDAGGGRIDALFARPDQPLQLDFAQGRVGVSGGCNRIGGSYAREGDTLQISQLVQTEMACEQILMAQDQAIVDLLPGELALGLDGSDPPTLTLTTADGARLAFAGEATAETRFGGPGERMFLEVAPQRVDCHHPLIPDKQCLHVREIRFDEQGLRDGEPGEWQFLYEDIEGYTHEPGIRNVLRVYRHTREPTPADASSIVYVHDMTVESAIE